MTNIIQVIVAAVTALSVPLASADVTYAPEPEPLILATSTSNQVEVETEQKPIPEPESERKLSACNCYNLIEEKHDEVPSMQTLQQSAGPEVGNVAVFMYPPTEAWPGGIPHVAAVLGTTSSGTVMIEEYNYHQCQHTTREILLTDHRLIGFVTL